MTTSLQAITNKARRVKKHRFQNLCGCLTVEFLIDSWRYINKNSAPGIDKRSAREYGKNLRGNIEDLVKRLKEKRYSAKLIKRVYIPKANGKLRPLGLPSIEDKLVQTAVSRLLMAIYEEDFMSCSFGYRPKRGAKDAVYDLTHALNFGRFTYIVEADIKGFFDNIDHKWLIKMLKQRIDDRVIIRLIEKWLRAGILDTSGKVIHPITGTPQGGIISPILANIYLHYALDIWFEKVVKKHCEGEAYICRYADDFVCAFRFARDSEKLQDAIDDEIAVDFSTFLVGTTWTIENKTYDSNFINKTGKVTFYDSYFSLDTGAFATAGLLPENQDYCIPANGKINYEIICISYFLI
jgi:group II intron reverse transcriptase/maturase